MLRIFGKDFNKQKRCNTETKPGSLSAYDVQFVIFKPTTRHIAPVNNERLRSFSRRSTSTWSCSKTCSPRTRGKRGRRDASDARPNNGGGDRDGRRLAEPLDPIVDDMCDERCSRAFGLPLLGLAFLTVVLPVAVHHYSSAQNDTAQSSQLYSTSNRFYPSPRPVRFNYFADSMLMQSATTPRHAEAWQRNDSSGIGRIILDWQRLLGVKLKTNTTSTTARTSTSSTKRQNLERLETSRSGSTSSNVYGAPPTSAGVDKNADANERPYWPPPIGPQNLLAQGRRFFEKKSTLRTRSRDSNGAGDEHPHDAQVEYDVRRRGTDQRLPKDSSVTETDGATERGSPGGAPTGEPVPPLGGSQLWCVYQPVGDAHVGTAMDDDEYRLDDVPVSLCTAVVYCCLDLWRHGVRTYQPSSTARPRGPPGGRWYDRHSVEEYQHEGDGGPQGIYHFSRLRKLRGAPPTLKLYAMLGGHDRTTYNFTRKMADVSPDEATPDDRDASNGRGRQRNARRQNDVDSANAGVPPGTRAVP
ncbi:hypothetical protein HPB51_013662 [Rhipicephalus microplus]|uniref:Uncharacterized protein n=1 Tax=Rhipicephalus microplus TaxID=6941 RepID=A0A9J6E1M2_RHIMP|nr:hypothetical protein HPB51_013662 [Rhipicephalus microplus]